MLERICIKTLRCGEKINRAPFKIGYLHVRKRYNGTPPGDDRSCGATGKCPRALDPNSEHSKGDYDLCWATHSEANAIIRASWEELKGSTIYITGDPCPGCAKLIASAGIERMVTYEKEA